MKTQFAPAEREPLEVLLEQKSTLERIDNIKGLLSSLSYIVFILNDKRQIVFANELLLKKLNISDELKLTGARPGEVLACVHAENKTGGCGTSSYCRYCSAVNVILDAQNHVRSSKEARIIVKNGEHEKQLDLELTASPLLYEAQNFVVLSAQDITEKKQKQLLERIFFHDIINLAGSLDGIMETMDEMTCEEKARFFKSAKRISNTLIDEIMAQQELVKAENNELRTNPEGFVINELIERSVDNIRHHEVARNKTIIFNTKLNNAGIITDKVLLNRVIVNMLKNALEATKPNGTVTLTLLSAKDKLLIKVNNDAVMPESVQKQLFQRSFSTKGAGRGIGTYSMKLLSENYLNGSIAFISKEKTGTTFTLNIPKKLLS